jgi:hypothetical protein
MATKLTSCIAVLLILLLVSCKKNTNKEYINTVEVSPRTLATGDTLKVVYEYYSKNSGFVWYRINSSPQITGYLQIGEGETWNQWVVKTTFNTPGTFTIQGFLGDVKYDDAGARARSSAEQITVTGQTQTGLSIYLPVDSGSYCVNRKIPFWAEIVPDSIVSVWWYYNEFNYLGSTWAGSIDSFTIPTVGVHDIMAWVSSSINSHVGIYVGNPFTIEYDHQQSFDVFPQGPGAVEKAFKYGFTYLDIIYDTQDTLENNCILYDSLATYYRMHVQKSGGNPLFPGYLCGVEEFVDGTGYVIDTILGASTRGKGFTFIAVQLASQLELGDPLDAVTIHELGHHRAELPHLCSSTGMNPFHNDSACVMSNSFPVATCTGKNVVVNAHFCPACSDSLKKITW